MTVELLPNIATGHCVVTGAFSILTLPLGAAAVLSLLLPAERLPGPISGPDGFRGFTLFAAVLSLPGMGAFYAFLSGWRTRHRLMLEKSILTVESKWLRKQTRQLSRESITTITMNVSRSNEGNLVHEGITFEFASGETWQWFLNSRTRMEIETLYNILDEWMHE